MPRKSGLQVIDFVRREVCTQLPVLVFSCISNAAVIESCLATGANAFIAKPFCHDKILTVAFNMMAYASSRNLPKKDIKLVK